MSDSEVGTDTPTLAALLHLDPAPESQLAFTDPETGFPNRRHAGVYLEREFARAKDGWPVAVVFFDFDQLADEQGDPSPVGEAAVQALSQILSETTRRNNISARWTDQVFITVLSGSDAEGGLVFAERVRQRVEASAEIEPRLTVSAGVAAYHPAIESPEALLADAEAALQEARDDGVNRVRGHGPLRDPGLELMVAPEAPVDRVPSNGEPASLGRGRRLLLVEDDRDLRSSLSTYLSRHEFTIAEAADAPTALWELRGEFDVLITDVRLPGGSGTELVSALKSRWPETQAIVITGLKDATVAAEALNAGADRYLFKPFDLEELKGHLQTALAKRRRAVGERQERQQLSQEARERADQARRAILKGARALVTAVEVRDPYTQGHSMRVSAYSGLLAAAAVKDGSVDLDALRLACELHDVGKIGVPDAILNKPGALTPNEYDEVRLHPLTGRRILEPLLSDKSVLAVVGWHHERWDGKGYPDGLSGDRIPLVARIVAIADALDAMTSTRAYRTSLSWKGAIDQILRSFGTHFDPALEGPFRAAQSGLRQLFDDLEQTPS